MPSINLSGRNNPIMGTLKRILIDMLESIPEVAVELWREWIKDIEQEKRKKQKEAYLKKYGYRVPTLKQEFDKTEFLLKYFKGRLLESAPGFFQDIPEGEGLVVVRYLDEKESARFAHTEEAFRTLIAYEPPARKDFILIKSSILCGLTGCEEDEYERGFEINQEKITAEETLKERVEIIEDGRNNDSEMWNDIDPDVYGYPLLNKMGRPKIFKAEYLIEKHSGLLLKKPPPSFSKILKGQALIVILEKKHTDNARFAHTSRAFINLVKLPRDPWCGQSTNKKYVYLDYPVACKMASFPPPPPAKLNKPKPKKKTKSKSR